MLLFFCTFISSSKLDEVFNYNHRCFVKTSMVLMREDHILLTYFSRVLTRPYFV